VTRRPNSGAESIPPAAGDRYTNVKISQQRRGVPLDENDLWIAATALALDAPLVSLDSDFQGIEALAVVEPHPRYSPQEACGKLLEPFKNWTTPGRQSSGFRARSLSDSYS